MLQLFKMAVRVTCRQNDLSIGRCLLWSLRESDEVKSFFRKPLAHTHTHSLWPILLLCQNQWSLHGCVGECVVLRKTSVHNSTMTGNERMQHHDVLETIAKNVHNLDNLTSDTHFSYFFVPALAQMS